MGLGIDPPEGVIFMPNMGRLIVTNGDLRSDTALIPNYVGQTCSCLQIDRIYHTSAAVNITSNIKEYTALNEVWIVWEGKLVAPPCVTIKV